MALDFSSTKYVFFTQNATVYKTLTPTFEKEDLAHLNDENLQSTPISQRVKEAQRGLKTIHFRDPITGELTQSGLSEESLARLKELFGAADFHQRKNDSLILSGGAERFVSGWYGDIAYQRGYLSADKNRDGFMEKEELDATRSGFAGHGFGILNGNKVSYLQEDYVESYIPLGGYATSPIGMAEFMPEFQKTLYHQGKFAAKTLALELDKTIKNDKNLDGIVEYGEILTQAEMEQSFRDGMEYVIGQASEGAFDPLAHINPLDLILRDADKKSLLDKLAQKDFDPSKLSKEELEKLRENFSQFFEGDAFKKEEAQEFYEDLKENFTQKSLEFLGLSQKDGISYEKLSSVMDEMLKNFKDTNVSSRTLQGLELWV